jgi:hypothetical protein
VKAFNRRFLQVKTFLHNLVLLPTATATFFNFLIIHKQYHWLISSIKKASPYHERSGENKSRNKTEAALDCTRIQKKLQQTTTTDYKDLILRSLLRGTPSLALPKRDKPRASSRPGFTNRKRHQHHRYGLCCRESTPHNINHRYCP